MAEEEQERTEPATYKKRTQVKEEGQVTKSTDLNSVISLLMGIALLTLFGNYIFMNLNALFKISFSSFPKNDLSPDEIHNRFIAISWYFAKMVLPVMGGLMATGFLSNYIQVGNAISLKSIFPKFERIDPLKGFKRIFSWKSLIILLKSFIKIFIIGYIAYILTKKELDVVMHLSDMEVNQIISTICSLILNIGLKISFSLLLLALADYGYERWSFEKNIKMTRQEVKDELKDTEGNPLVKSRIKSIQRQMTMHRMMTDVPKADVVITNPTHLAVALKYDSESMGAPKVIAKGARLVAERIKEIARKNNVPVVENKPLARSLYKLCNIGKEIPVQLYRAVAELLAYVYKAQGRRVM